MAYLLTFSCEKVTNSKHDTRFRPILFRAASLTFRGATSKSNIRAKCALLTGRNSFSLKELDVQDKYPKQCAAPVMG